ncbi:MAG: dephospho-CoA kinase [Elusimicrobiota bacterium]|nr:dephospho-CoA kinase [Elusimicrobiota bacterium]
MKPDHLITQLSNRSIIVGLTGGIATGKSTVVKEFKKLGAEIIDSDRIAHRVIRKGSKQYRKILKVFGKEILKSNKEINRKKLAKIIFENSKKRKLLEKITHPAIISEIKTELTRLSAYSPTRLIVLDAPLLFEKKLDRLVDKTVLVYAPEKVQIKRIMRRDKISKENAIRRISAQLPIEYKKNLANYIINTSCSLNSVMKQTKKIFQNLLTNKI